MIDDDDEFDRLVAPVLAAARAEDARLPEGCQEGCHRSDSV